MVDKIRIAFVKFGGMSAGGTERWLQMMAANMDPDRFTVDYYYCDAAPYVGTEYRHADTDASRLRYMRAYGVNLIKFHVGAKDITVPTHDWLDTDFWDVFRPEKYDFVQAAKAGPAEYPFIHMQLPVVEFVALLAGVDPSPNIVWSVHLSPWQWVRWCRMGGSSAYSSVIPVPVLPPATKKNLREELGIPSAAVVAGFHQRADEHIFSPVPLAAFAATQKDNRHFIIMGGAEKYRMQAKELGLRNIHFLPHVGDAERISSFLNTLDVFAHGRSDGETFGTVLAEAMMHGKCCLSHQSDSGANAQPETMGPAGLFASSQEEYAACLDRLFDDARLRARLSEKAGPHAEKYYSLKACVTGLEDLYETLAGKKAHQSVISASPTYGWSPLGYLQAGSIADPACIAYHILSGEAPEHYDVEIFTYFLQGMNVMLDIGANIGLYCLVAAKGAPGDARIHAFEPQPDCCARLRETAFLNNWEDRLFIHQTALGRSAGTGVLQITGTGSSLDPFFNANDTLPTIHVPVTTLDDFVRSHLLEKIDFIKIDTEGFEQQVLDGGEESIRRFQPVLFIEIADRVRGRDYRNANYERTLQWLLDRGYSLYRSTEDGRLEAASPEQEQDHLHMYLCLPAHRASEITKIEAWCKAAQKGHEAAQRGLMSRSRRFTGRLGNFFLLLLQNPRAAVSKIRRRLRALAPKMLLVPPITSAPRLSYERHDQELSCCASLPRHRVIAARIEEQNLFNHPQLKHADLLRRHPGIREIAVDIGSGAGWCSARLSREFRRVISVEPSKAGHAIAEACFPSADYPQITRFSGVGEEVLPTLSLQLPAFFVTNTVLSHLPDETVSAICKAVCAVAHRGSILSFSECWGAEHHQELWHVRTQDWWRAQFPSWKLDFHGPQIEGVHGRHKGIHGVYTC